MFGRFQGFIMIVMILALLMLIGCSQEIDNDLEVENQELRSKVSELELIVDEQNIQIEEYEKVYDLRNVLDIQARQILSALNSGVFTETEAELLNENAIIEEDRLIFSFDNSNNEILFFQNKLDFERVRQRSYHLDEEGRFITGYEIIHLSDDIQEHIDSRAVFIFTFIKEPSGWRLADIGIDR